MFGMNRIGTFAGKKIIFLYIKININNLILIKNYFKFFL